MFIYLRQGGYVIIVVCLSVCLSVNNLRKNFWTDLHEIFREGWQWASEQMIEFRWRELVRRALAEVYTVPMLLFVIIITATPSGVMPSIAILWSACLCVCLSVRSRLETTSKFHRIFYTCYLWPWFGPVLTSVHYVLPVLWIASSLHIMGHFSRHSLISFARGRQQCACSQRRVGKT